MKVAVVTIGAVLEWSGILLIASPELVPRWWRARAALGRWMDRMRAWLRRLLRRHRVVTGAGAATGRASASGSAIVIRGRPTHLNLEDKVEWLLDEYERTQERLGVAENTLHEHPDTWRRDIEQAKGEMETVADAKIEAARDAYINRRLVGVVFVLLGLPLLAWANFL